MEIQQSTNYAQFKKIKGNRAIRARSVRNLEQAITLNDLLSVNPIIVTKDFKVIDGQTRLEAAKNLGKPIYYIIWDDDSLSLIHSLNNSTVRWTSQDYLDSYIVLGKKDYMIFGQLLKEYGLSHSALLILIYGEDSGGIFYRFRNGELDLSNRRLDKVKEKLELMYDLVQFFSEKKVHSKFFYRAVNKMFTEGHLEILISKLRVSGKKLETAWSMREYLRQFEDVLNYNVKTEANITRLF